MQIQTAIANPGVRIGLSIAGGLVVLALLAAMVRPQMFQMGMQMVHNLIVGFGL